MKKPLLKILKLRAVEIGFPNEFAKDEILDKIFSIHGHDTHIMIYQVTFYEYINIESDLI